MPLNEVLRDSKLDEQVTESNEGGWDIQRQHDSSLTLFHSWFFHLGPSSVNECDPIRLGELLLTENKGRLQ